MYFLKKKPTEYETTTTYKPTEYETKPTTTYKKPYTTKKYVYTTPKYYEGETVKSEYDKPESFQKYKPEKIDAPEPKPYYETEKPYVPLELTTPNVSYYLPDYKPVNPEIPVVHGLPNAPKPKVIERSSLELTLHGSHQISAKCMIRISV